jgi:raffinose/stachyose/melibiose transport system substrate-binding protein
MKEQQNLLKALSDTQTLYDLTILDFNVEGFWYNKKIFSQWEFGTTLRHGIDFYEVCDILLEAGIQPFSAGGADKWPLTRYINAYAYRSMGNYVMDLAADGSDCVYRLRVS